MPPKKKAAPRAAKPWTRKSTRKSNAIEYTVPDVYQEMLAEAVAEAPPPVSPRPAKRRKVSVEPKAQEPADTQPVYQSGHLPEPEDDGSPDDASSKQIVYDEFGDSDEDMEFEDVDLEVSDSEERPETRVLTIDLSEPLDLPAKKPQRRQLATIAERKMRLDWHKAHLYLLLLSLWCRNRWCESPDVQKVLKPLVPRKVVKLLHEDESKPQVQQSYSFNKGIEEILMLWRTTWTTTNRGMRRAYWRENIDAEKESSLAEEIDFDDFKTAAHTRRGSRDLGAQLFCALLRSVAVEARLVCSLQVLPFSASAKEQTPEKRPKQNYAYAPAQNFGSSSSSSPRRKIKDSPYPIYWVEVFSPATSTWIPLDPLVRHTINKPKTGFEPPASDHLNSMLYVIAFEDDGSARDVTRRYTQWFNAKTRKTRVESTKGGEDWWHATMATFTKPFKEDRDDLEDAELLHRSEAEGMPKNVQDFKGHPIYVLERHLRMSEVIHPKREVGKTTVGSNRDSQKLESVFRRSDVHHCRTSDAWYRRGRDVGQGEVPLKRLSRKAKGNVDFDGEYSTDQEEATLYAEYQTEVYEPPEVEHGRVPRNAFGNIDIYVPSMIPAGAVHVQHPLAAKAAKLMGISFVEAVTGFEFKGRQGTAVISGVVIPAEARFGLVTVIIGMQNDAVSEALAERSALLLALWKKWLTGLRIRNRIQREYGGADDDGDDEDDATYSDHDGDTGGGFVLEDSRVDEEPTPSANDVTDATSKVLLKGLPPEPTTTEIVVTESPHKSKKQSTQSTTVLTKPHSEVAGGKAPADQEPGGFFAEDDDGGGGFVPEDQHPNRQGDLVIRHEAEVEVMTDHIPSATGGGISRDPHRLSEDAVGPLQDLNPTMTMPMPEPGGSVLHPSERERGATVREGSTLSADPATSEQDERPPESEYTGPAASSVLDTEPHVDDANVQTDPTPLSDAEDQASSTSMLSHDPDEDELEPEWLLDSLGD